MNNLAPFTEVIDIKVPVQTIFNKMKEVLPDDYKHKEVLAHAIVGSAVTNGGIGYIYNALGGFTNDIDFTEGDVVECTEVRRIERYDANKENEKGEPTTFNVSDEVRENVEPNWKTRKVAIGRCKVLKINLYGVEKLQVEYNDWDRYDNKMQTVQTWVTHRNCSRIPLTAPAYR